jgi:AraC-like DNA-binding protein
MAKKRQPFFDLRNYQIRAGVPSEYAHADVIEPHSHPWHQLTFASQGVVTVRTREGSWVVPTHRGVWVPARTRHRLEMSGKVSLRALYVAPSLSTSLPDKCCVVAISPLMRELILRVSELKGLKSHLPLHAHLVPVMLDHLQMMESDPIHLPLPRDGRAKRIVSLLQGEPSDRRPLEELARSAGGSKRTIERLFKAETGLGFGKWRQQFRLGQALRLLAAGQAVTSVALDVGYESPSAFISAFRMTFGHTPGEYFRSA